MRVEKVLAGRIVAHLTLAVSSPNVLVVHPSVSARSVKELIALAKARPGELNYASAAAGTIPHLAAEAIGSSPQEFAAKIKSEIARLGKVIRDAGIRDE